MRLFGNAVSAVLLSGIFVSVSTICPSKCMCTISVLNCSYVGLTSVPNFTEIFPYKPTVIDLSGNDIYEISANDFKYKGNEKVKVLYANDNKILDVHDNALKPLKFVREISLAGNLLESVPSTMIVDNKEMTQLDLSGNYFSSNTPQIQSGSLEALDLSSSKITTFTEENTKHLPNLKVLNLRHNNLKKLSPRTFHKLPLLYVEVGLNMWECSNATVELFNYLTTKNLTVIENEPVKCVTNNKKFRPIYNDQGSVNIENLTYAQGVHEPSQASDRMLEDEADLDYASYEYDLPLGVEPIFGQERGEEVLEDYPHQGRVEQGGEEDYPMYLDPEMPKIAKPSTEETYQPGQDLRRVVETKDGEKSSENGTVIMILEDPEEEPDIRQMDDKLYFRTDVFVFMGVFAFSLTFLAGVLFGVGFINDFISRRRRDVNGSTAKLILDDYP